MSAADKRVADLLDRWLASLELHARYLDLDDAAYARVQDWPQHQRPTKWVVELARARLIELRRQLAERQARGDGAFAESLELMNFLGALLGMEHVERFIPLAEPQAARPPVPAPSPPPVPAPARAPEVATVRAPGKPERPPAPRAPRKSDTDMTANVIADAVRFLSWGREWPQLASSIARLADRPPETEIWRILRENRAAIEAQARRPPD